MLTAISVVTSDLFVGLSFIYLLFDCLACVMLDHPLLKLFSFHLSETSHFGWGFLGTQPQSTLAKKETKYTWPCTGPELETSELWLPALLSGLVSCLCTPVCAILLPLFAHWRSLCAHGFLCLRLAFFCLIRTAQCFFSSSSCRLTRSLCVPVPHLQTGILAGPARDSGAHGFRCQHSCSRQLGQWALEWPREGCVV